MECMSNTPYYYDMQARLGSFHGSVSERFTALEDEHTSIRAGVKTVEEGLLEQAAALEEECRRRRHQIKKVRHELGLRIQELEEAGETRHQQVLENIDETLAGYDRRLEALAAEYEATVRELSLLGVQVSENTAAIEAERKIRADQYSALADESERLEARVGDRIIAEVSKEAKARADAISAEAEQREKLRAELEGVGGLIESVQTALVNSEKVSAEERRLLAAYVGELAEGMLNLSGTQAFESDTRRQKIALAREELHAEIVEEQEARASHELELYAQIEGNKALIQEEQEARATADEAEAKARETLAAKVGENTASIETVREVVSNADKAKSGELITYQSYLGNLTEAELQNALNEADGQARRRLKLARAQQEFHTELEEGKKASARYRLELLALMEGNDAEYTQKINAISDQTSAQVTSLEKLSAKVDSNEAAITEEAKVRSTANEAIASQVSTLQAAVNGHTSSINTLNEVKDGITARSFLHLDTNGYVSGIESYNGGVKDSSFKVIADKFQIVPPNTKDPQDIFEYDSTTQKLKVKNIEVDGADIKAATIGSMQIGSGAVTGGNIANNTIITENILDGAVSAVNIYTVPKFTVASPGEVAWARCYPPEGEIGARLVIMLSYVLSCPDPLAVNYQNGTISAASSLPSRIKTNAYIKVGTTTSFITSDSGVESIGSEDNEGIDKASIARTILTHEEDNYWYGSGTFTFLTNWTRDTTSVVPVYAQAVVAYENTNALCNAVMENFSLMVLSLRR